MREIRFLTQFEHLNHVIEAKQSFEQANPDVRVIIEQATDHFESLQAMQGDTPPDIIETGGFPIGNLDGMYIDLNPYIAETDGLEEDLYPGLMKVARHGGQLPALPVEVMPPLILYNKTLFDRAGLAYPTDDWTWDEMVELAKQLTLRNEEGLASQFGFRNGVDIEWFEPFVMRNGGRYISLDGSTSRGYVDSPATIEAFRRIIDSYRVHGIVRKPGEPIEKGIWYEEFAMTLAYVWFAGNLLDTHKLDDRFEVVGLPKMQGGEEVNMIYMGGAGITTKCSNPRLAWEFLRHYIVDCHSWQLPISKSQAERRGMTQHHVWSRYLKELDHVQLSGFFLNRKWNSARQLINEDINRMILEGADVAQTMRSWTRYT